MDNQKTGRLIARRRKEKGLTQKELGRRLHVSDRAVSKWERGLNLPDAALFEPLCRELDITVTELLRGEREEPTHAQLEQTVCDAVALAGEKERRAFSGGRALGSPILWLDSPTLRSRFCRWWSFIIRTTGKTPIIHPGPMWSFVPEEAGEPTFLLVTELCGRRMAPWRQLPRWAAGSGRRCMSCV